MYEKWDPSIPGTNYDIIYISDDITMLQEMFFSVSINNYILKEKNTIIIIIIFIILRLSMQSLDVFSFKNE